MTNQEAINYLCNLRVAIGRTEHQALWHYEQPLAEIIDMLSEETHDKRTKTHACVSPCDECRHYPPSSADGKPCSMCPAEGRSE